MTPTERKRIEKEADEYGQWVMDKTKDFHDGINAKDAYVAGATSEHDKARNQGIDEAIIDIGKLNDNGMLYYYTAIKVLESLKTNQLT